jgi:hypothetical protein
MPIRIAALLLAALALPRPAVAQPADGWTLFPTERIFTAPLADQKQPRTHVTYQAYQRGDQSIPIASVGYGMDWGFAARGTEESAIQIGVDGAVFAVFNLDAPSMDLINADYFVGIPIDYRRGQWSLRVRPFHLSSHLGDEFLLYPQPRDPVERINVSFEAVETLLSWESGSWRIYGGGFSVFHSTAEIMEDRAQVGLEYRGSPFGRAGARWIAGLDVQEADSANADPDFSFKGGIELVPPGKTRGLQLLLEYYDGRAPHGQFGIEEEVEYWGVGMVFVF